MSRQFKQQPSHNSNTQHNAVEELSDKELTTVTGGSAAEDAKNGAIIGAALGGSMGLINGFKIGKKHGKQGGIVYGVMGGVGGGVGGAAHGAVIKTIQGGVPKKEDQK